jgi:O-antigen/teichoic acid export membrane protein
MGSLQFRLRTVLKSDLRRRIARSTTWVLAGSIVSQGAALAASVVVARLLDIGTFGQFGMVVNTIGMLGVFAGMGLGITATKHIAEFRVSNPQRAGTILLLANLSVIVSSSVIAAVLFFSAPWTSSVIMNAPGLELQLQFASILIVLNALNAVQIAALGGFEAFDVVAKLNFVRGVLSLPLAIILTPVFGINGAILSVIISSAIICVLSQVALQRQMRKAGVRGNWANIRQEAPILWRFAFPALIAGIVVWPVMWWGNVLLVKFPGGYAELSTFNAANQWRTALLFLPNVVGQAMLPIFASIVGTSETHKSHRLMLVSSAASGIIAGVAAIVLILFNQKIMGLYGPIYSNHGDVLVVISLTVVLIAVQNPIGQAIIANGKIWTLSLLNLAWATLFIIVAYLLISKGFGALGLSYAYAISYLFHLGWTFITVGKLGLLNGEPPLVPRSQSQVIH